MIASHERISSCTTSARGSACHSYVAQVFHGSISSWKRGGKPRDAGRGASRRGGRDLAHELEEIIVEIGEQLGARRHAYVVERFDRMKSDTAIL